MIELVPNYYKDFKCIADKCRHTCCAGWEIDIDPKTYDLYQSLDKGLRDRILSHIDIVDGTPSFRLEGSAERCPMLRGDGLCDLILERGDESLLCNICRDHPRFRNFREGVTEIGLGLACEEAARIILGASEPFELVRADGGDTIPIPKEEVYLLRNRDIKIMTDRSIPLRERISAVCGSTTIDSKMRAKIFSELEILDPKWSEMLDELFETDAHEVFIPGEICYEQLIVYYLFRYPMYTGRYALECALLATDMCISLEEPYTLEDIVRRLSAEVEYSDINSDDLAQMLGAVRQ